MSFYQEQISERKRELFLIWKTAENLTGLIETVIVISVKPYSMQWYATTIFLCQEARRSLTVQYIERGNKNRELDNMKREHRKEK